MSDETRVDRQALRDEAVKAAREALGCEKRQYQGGSKTHGGPPEYENRCLTHRKPWPCPIPPLAVDAILVLIPAPNPRAVEGLFCSEGCPHVPHDPSCALGVRR